MSNREPVALLQQASGIARLTFGSGRIWTILLFVGPQLLSFGLHDVEPGVAVGKFIEGLAGDPRGDVDVVANSRLPLASSWRAPTRRCRFKPELTTTHRPSQDLADLNLHTPQTTSTPAAMDQTAAAASSPRTAPNNATITRGIRRALEYRDHRGPLQARHAWGARSRTGAPPIAISNLTTEVAGFPRQVCLVPSGSSMVRRYAHFYVYGSYRARVSGGPMVTRTVV